MCRNRALPGSFERRVAGKETAGCPSHIIFLLYRLFGVISKAETILALQNFTDMAH